jgi:hypothetical protein
MRPKLFYTLIILIFTILYFSTTARAGELSIPFDLAANSNQKIIAQPGDRPVLILTNAIPGVSYEITATLVHENILPIPGSTLWNPILSSIIIPEPPVQITESDLIKSLKKAALDLATQLTGAEDEPKLPALLKKARAYLKLLHPESVNSNANIFGQLSQTAEFKYLTNTDPFFRELFGSDIFQQITRPDMEKISEANEWKRLQTMVNGTTLTENRDVKIDLDTGDTVSYKIVRNDPGGGRPRKEWTLTVTVPQRGAWQITYGLAALPNNDRLYYSEETGPGTYTIKQQAPASGYNIKPVLFYTWKDPAHQEWFRPSAGISLEAKPAIFLGQDFVFHENFHILVGYAFEPQKRLGGNYRPGQTITENLSPDSLVTESYQGNWFISLSFFFGNNTSPNSATGSSSQPASGSPVD